MRNHRKLIYLPVAVCLYGLSTAFAASPPNLNTDIEWDENPTAGGNQQSYANAASVEAAFNNGRRREEQQLSLASNTLGTLNLPSQNIWNATTNSEKALFIINAERQARAVNFSNGPALGIPLEGVETHIDTLAQRYADYMVANNFWDHGVPANITAQPFAGTNSFSRIDNDPVIGNGVGSGGSNCHQFITRAENLYIAASSSTAPIPMIVERALYGFIYDDAGSNWGHREALFLQDTALNGGTGFSNDRGSSASEGLMGLGIAGRTDGSFDPVGFGASRFPNQQALVWLVFDPASNAACNYGVASNYSLPGSSWRLISLPATPPAGSTVGDLFADDIPGTYATDWIVYDFNEQTGEYEDPGINGTLAVGDAFWIIHLSNNVVLLDMPVGTNHAPVTQTAACTAPAGCWSRPQIAKPLAQWNAVGNPFRTAPAIGNLRVTTSSGACADSNGCTLTEAQNVNSANIQRAQFWWYDGNVYQASEPGDSMVAWRGYWNQVLPGANNRSPTLLFPRY